MSAGGDGVVVRWHVDHPAQGLVLVKVGEPIYSLAHDADRDALLVGTGSGRLVVIDLAREREVQVAQVHQKGIFRIVPHHQNGFLCAGGDGVMSVWRWSSDGAISIHQERSISLCAEKLRDIAVLRGSDHIAIACGDGAVRVLEAVSFNETYRMDGHTDGAYAVCQHATKPVLLSGGKDGELKVWRTDGSLLHTAPAHKGSVYVITTDPGGRWLLTAGRDALVNVWDAGTLEPVIRSQRDRDGHTHSVNAAVWCGDLLITASDDRRIRSWRIPPEI